MCVGVLIGLDTTKFSGSMKIVGQKLERYLKKTNTKKIPKESLIEKNGWKSKKSIFLLIPRGLLDSLSCK